tara:strand:+ start:21 stop:2816 length:2796 start_codon:yes stop_codon:yes gene_type:complete
MLFTISSNGETDHAKFSNYFNDSVILKPNSFICLISASVVEDLNNTIITIPANTSMTLRFDPLNQFTAIINVLETTYSIREFKDRLNTVFGGLQIHIKNAFICRVRTVDDNLELAFNFYNKLSTDRGDTILSWILPTNPGQLAYEPQQALNYCTLSNPTLTFDHGYVNPPTTNADNNCMLIQWTSSPGGQNNATPFEAQPNYVIGGGTFGLGMVRAANRESFQLYGDAPNPTQFTYLDRINHHQFTINQCPDTVASDATEVHHFTIGPSNCANGVLFDDAPMNGYFSYQHRKLDMKFKGDGILDIDVLNKDTGALEQAHTGRFAIGNMYRIGLFQNTNATATVETAYMPIVIQYDYQGQVYWWPGSVQNTGGTYGTALTWNTKNTKYNPGINFMYKNAARDHTASILSNDYVSTPTNLGADNTYMGCWGGNGFQNDTRDNNSLGRFRDNGLNEAIQVASYNNNAGYYIQQLPVFKRVDLVTPEPATPNSSKKNIYAMTINNTMLQTKGVTCFSCLFFAINDSAVVTLPNSEIMTVIGGRNTLNITQGAVVQIGLNQTFAYDIEVFDDAGTGHQFTLSDIASGARANILFSTWYQLCYFDNGSGTFNVELVDIVNENRFTRTGGVGVLGSGRLRNPMTIAGSDSDMTLNPASDYFSGHVCQFRFFQQPRYAGTTVATWDEVRTALVNGYSRFGTDPLMVGAPVETQLVNETASDKYYSMPDVNTTETNSPFFWCEGFKDANAQGYGQFSDILMIQNVKLQYNTRDRLVQDTAITDYGVGLTGIEQLHTAIAFEDYDAGNERAIEEVLDFQTVAGPDTPYFDEPAEVSNVALEDEVFNVEITNLPHRSLNGKNHSYDKTIYQLPVETTSKEIQGVKITEHTSEQKVWIPLNNAGDIPISKLDIQISKEDGTKADNLQEDTHLVLQIEQRGDII